MKKILLGLLIGVGVAIPATAMADYVVRTPHAKYIYDAGVNNGIKVDVFDDAGNKCYIAYKDRGTNYIDEQPAISCLKN